jgi:hypothetical protein
MSIYVEEKWHPVISRKEIDRNIKYHDWASYKEQNREVAREIELLGLDFSKLSANDINEREFALQITALDSKCRISELKDRFIKACSKCEDWMLLRLIERTERNSIEEGQKYNISKDNTFDNISLIWIYEIIDGIENKINYDNNLSKDSVLEMSMKFDLESNDKFLWERKWHIYVKHFPQNPDFIAFKKEVMDAVKRNVENAIQYLNDINELKNNPSIYNLSLSTELMKCREHFENMDKFGNIVDGFNKRDLSYYVELQIVIDEIKRKYKK